MSWLPWRQSQFFSHVSLEILGNYLLHSSILVTDQIIELIHLRFLKLRLLYYKSWRDKYFPYNPIEEVLVLKASFRFRYHFLASKICKNNYLWGYKDILTKSLPTHHVSGIQSSTVNICTLIRHVCLRSLEVDWQATKLRWFLYDSVSANVFIIFSVVILNII